MRAQQPIELETKRYRLRTLTAADVTDRFVHWFSDPEVMEYVNLAMNLDRSEVKRFIAQFDSVNRYAFGIHDKQNNQPVGFYHIYLDRPNGRARIGLLIGEKDHWGTGIVLETRVRILDFLFDELNLHKVWGAIFTRNMPALFNYKAQGFRYEGLLRGELRTRDGSWRDVYRFAMLHEDWLELRKQKADG